MEAACQAPDEPRRFFVNSTSLTRFFVNFREIAMKNYFVKRGWIALVVICSVAALQATASAQTNLYWQGGPGTWAMTGTTTQWYPGVY